MEPRFPSSSSAAPAPITVAEVDGVRARLDELTAEWAAVPVNGSLTVEF